MHVARGMVFREIELGEVIVFGLDIRPLGNAKAHIGKDRGQFIDHLGDRMDAPGLERRLAHRQRDVDAFGIEPRLERQGLERFATRHERRIDAIFQPVDQRTFGLALLRRQRAKSFQQGRNGAVLAQRRHAHRFERCFVAGGGDFGEDVLLKRRGIGHDSGQSGMTGRSVSCGVPPACVSMQCTWPR